MDTDQGESQSLEVPSVDSRVTDLAARFRSMPTSDVPVEREEAPAEVEQEGSTTTETLAEHADSTPVEELIEVDYEGAKVKVPSKVKDALLRQADYTRKTQEVAEVRRTAERELAMVRQQMQLSAQLAPAMGQLANMDAQLRQIHEQLSPDLEVNDPLRYSTLGTKLNTLLMQRQQFAQGLQQHHMQLMQNMQQGQSKMLQERAQAELPKVKAVIKDFSPETGKELLEYAKNTGYSQEEIESISFSAPGVISLWKAREYDRMQKAKPVRKVVQNLPPVAKPGARGAVQSEQSARVKETEAAWRKGGGKDPHLLASLLHARTRRIK